MLTYQHGDRFRWRRARLRSDRRHRAYALDHISRGHFNPAVTVGLVIAKRVEPKAVVPYIIAQIIGGSLAGRILFIIASGKGGFSAVEGGFVTTVTANAPQMVTRYSR